MMLEFRGFDMLSLCLLMLCWLENNEINFSYLMYSTVADNIQGTSLKVQNARILTLFNHVDGEYII